jgi:hypothetical protein
LPPTVKSISVKIVTEFNKDAGGMLKSSILLEQQHGTMLC